MKLFSAMRATQLTTLVLCTAFTVSCTKEPKLDTDSKKATYAIGQQIGKSLKTQGIDFDPDVLVMSLRDASQNKEARMTQEEMQKTLMALQEGLFKKSQEEGEKNLGSGKKFLEDNKVKPGVKTTASGLQYEIITEGKGPKPKPTDTVKVHYKGTLTNGEVFDSSYDRNEPAEFPLNAVIKGWTEGIALLPVGSKAKFYIPPELGYGPMPKPKIPGNSVLVFEVELLDIVKKKK